MPSSSLVDLPSEVNCPALAEEVSAAAVSSPVQVNAAKDMTPAPVLLAEVSKPQHNSSSPPLNSGSVVDGLVLTEDDVKMRPVSAPFSAGVEKFSTLLSDPAGCITPTLEANRPVCSTVDSAETMPPNESGHDPALPIVYPDYGAEDPTAVTRAFSAAFKSHLLVHTSANDFGCFVLVWNIEPWRLFSLGLYEPMVDGCVFLCWKKQAAMGFENWGCTDVVYAPGLLVLSLQLGLKRSSAGWTFQFGSVVAAILSAMALLLCGLCPRFDVDVQPSSELMLEWLFLYLDYGCCAIAWAVETVVDSHWKPMHHGLRRTENHKSSRRISAAHQVAKNSSLDCLMVSKAIKQVPLASNQLSPKEKIDSVVFPLPTSGLPDGLKDHSLISDLSVLHQAGLAGCPYNELRTVLRALNGVEGRWLCPFVDAGRCSWTWQVQLTRLLGRFFAGSLVAVVMVLPLCLLNLVPGLELSSFADSVMEVALSVVGS
ncbi:hypothetical protein Nepgr_017430 [Nepenthes gracilis]|uniref:Uncharacterized protein n=1 Tax=Nepenthes gracilis TaxID=150966 RepID=A0AAD3SRF5_NEPGR|nr:hypothetical protein Nepgr_017430 [Nepenthes gracilis]